MGLFHFVFKVETIKTIDVETIAQKTIDWSFLAGNSFAVFPFVIKSDLCFMIEDL